MKDLRKENRELKIKFDEWETQAAIDANKGKLETQQAAIDRVTAQIPQVIPLYESDVQQGKKLSQEDKSRLEYVL